MKIKFGSKIIELPCIKEKQSTLIGLRVVDNDNSVLGFVKMGKQSIFIEPTEIGKQRYFNNRKPKTLI